MPTLSVQQAQAFCLSVLSQLAVPPREAETCADVLVETSLRGIDTHGLLLLPIYAQRIRSGQIKPGAGFEVVRDTPTTAMMDGRQDLGQVTGVVAMDLAIQKAKAHGLGGVVAFNCNHYGAASYYVMLALRHDLIGLGMANATPRVAPYGGAQGVHGTNPIAFAIPAGGHPPIVFDFATASAGGEIRRALLEGQAIREGLALDRSGRPTTDPQAALDGWLLPIAGPIGYGLGLMVDVFVGALSGSRCGADVPPVTDLISPYGCGFFMMAVDPAAFVGVERFKERVDFLIESVKACPPMEGFTEVRIPGERGFQERERRLREGIPFGEREWGKLLEELKAYGVEV